jgi:hypothetical protein
VEDGPRVGATVVRKDAGHVLFGGEDEFHVSFVGRESEILAKQNARSRRSARSAIGLPRT